MCQKSVKANGEKLDLFLEVLVHGSTNLYFYNDGADFHYFVEKADGRLYEFTKDQSFAYIDGKVHAFGTNMYTGLMRAAFADCPKIFSAIEVTSLDDISLIKLVSTYNNCNSKGGEGKSISYKTQLPGVKIKFAPFVSISDATLRFNNTYSFITIPNKIGNSPTIGFLMNTTFPRINEQLSLQISAEYGQNKFYDNTISPANQGAEDISINITSVKGKGGLKYTYPKGKIRPTLMVGGNILWMTKKDGSIIDHAVNPLYALQYHDYMIADSPMVGYSIDFGIDYHISKSIIPFINIGLDRSRNSQVINAVSIYAQNNFTTIINSYHLTAGIYF